MEETTYAEFIEDVQTELDYYGYTLFTDVDWEAEWRAIGRRCFYSDEIHAIMAAHGLRVGRDM